MPELMEFIQSRRPKGVTIGEYAKMLGITRAAYYHFLKQEREISLDTLQGFRRYFSAKDDVVALSYLASYALDLDGEFITGKIPSP